jgi:hypothetical protein
MPIIIYPALVKRAMSNLENSRRKRSVMKINGITRFEGIDLEIQENERILTLLTKSRRDVAPDLFSLNVELNHK